MLLTCDALGNFYPQQFQLLEKTRFSTSQSNPQLSYDKPDTSYEIWIASVLGIRDAQNQIQK